jgi:hypothetical protein
LRRGQKISVKLTANEPLGLMIVRADIHDLFRQPPHPVTLEGAASPVTHIPFR